MIPSIGEGSDNATNINVFKINNYNIEMNSCPMLRKEGRETFGLTQSSLIVLSLLNNKQLRINLEILQD